MEYNQEEKNSYSGDFEQSHSPHYKKNHQSKKLFCLTTLTVLAVVYTAYLAQDLVLLLVTSALIAILLSSGVNALQRIYIPRAIGAILLLSCLIVPISALVVQLEEPITKWTEKLPEVSSHISDTIDEYQESLDKKSSEAKKTNDEGGGWFSWFKEKPKVKGSSESKSMIQSKLKESAFTFAGEFLVLAPYALIQLISALILIIFTLVYSPNLFRHYADLFIAKDKQKKAFKFVVDMQLQLSRYILTVSAINILLGISAIIVLSLFGLEDALMWGIFVGFANFIPYVGPALALTAITLASSVQWGIDVQVLITVGGVLTLNVIESQCVTPLILAKNMRINPFIIIVWLLIIGWLWGLVGLLIAVPLLICIKLFFTLSEKTKPWVEFLET